MITQISDDLFFTLLRAAMGCGTFTVSPTDDEWRQLYQIAERQSLLGVCYRQDVAMPMDVAISWAARAEVIRGLNSLCNQEAARLTRCFADKGRSTAILKGQANARLYPNPLSRQPGDIDIWVEGGRESVITLLRQMGLVDELAATSVEGKPSASYHHVHLPKQGQGVTVEVHFRPSSGNACPETNRRLQGWLEEAIESTALTAEGFRVPTVRFALVMQLAHIQRHFLCTGIGLRHVCDYYWLLRNATDEDRRTVAGLLKPFGLHRTAGALMWVLGEVLHLDHGLMLCEPDAWRGKWLLREIMAGGNFGVHAKRMKHRVWRRFLEGKWRKLHLLRFDCKEVFWHEIGYWKTIWMTLPTRIKYRTLSLADVKKVKR